MLLWPRALREISRSSNLAEQGRLIASPDRPFEKSGVEPLIRRHIEWPWTTFRLGGVFSSLSGRLERKTRASARFAGSVVIPCTLRRFISNQDAAWRGTVSRARAGCRFVLSGVRHG